MPYDFFMSRYKEAYKQETLAFVRALRRDEPAPCSGRDGLVALIMAIGAGISAEEGRWVRFEEVRSPPYLPTPPHTSPHLPTPPHTSRYLPISPVADRAVPAPAPGAAARGHRRHEGVGGGGRDGRRRRRLDQHHARIGHAVGEI